MTGKEIKAAFIAAHKDYAQNLETKCTISNYCTFCQLSNNIRNLLKGDIISCACTMAGHTNAHSYSCTGMLTYVCAPDRGTVDKEERIALRKEFHNRAAQVLSIISPSAFIYHMNSIGLLLNQIDQELYYREQRNNPIIQDSIKIIIDPDKGQLEILEDK